MSAQDSSHGCGAVSLTCTMTGVTWECSTSSSRGEYVGEAYCPELMGGRVSEWEARAMRKHDEEQRHLAREQGLPVRARIQDEAKASRRRRSTEIRQVNRPVNGIANAADIHPALVSERLAASPGRDHCKSSQLADPVPDAEPDRPVPRFTRPHDARGVTFMTHPLFRKEIFVETAFAKGSRRCCKTPGTIVPGICSWLIRALAKP